MADLEVTIIKRVQTIRLNRPTKKNAFTPDMMEAIAALLDAAHEDPEIGAVVLTGTGDAFCAGADFSTLTPGLRTPLGNKQHLTDRVHRVAYAAERFDKPLIAAVNGVAVGAGMDLALMCDIRLAASSARFSEGYVRVGLVPGDGGCYYLPRIVGVAKALELLLTGDFIDAEEAGRIGLVNRVVEPDRLASEAAGLAERLAAGPPIALRMIKRAVYQSSRIDLRTSLDLISSHQAVVRSTEDSEEAMRAFREKRPPVFRGR